MTIQEDPLALAGGSATAWPVSLEPLPIESAGNDVVESGEGGCYPGWEFLRAGWTAQGRTFEARVGFASDVSETERDAMVAAFASMTFEPSSGIPSSVVLATGTAGGEDWDLIAARQEDGLGLMLQAESIGGGGGGFDPASPTLHLIDHVLGDGTDRERVVFGAVPSTAVRVEAIPEEWLGTLVVDLLDVPGEIDPGLDALVFVAPVDVRIAVTAYDASGAVLASAEVGPDVADPIETPLPTLVDVAPEHGGTYWGVYLWVSGASEDRERDAAVLAAEDLGFNPSVGDIACDQDAATVLGVSTSSTRVAIYFTTRRDAETAYEQIFADYREPVGLAEVTTFCLD
jgi:hypothetical protein